MIRKRFSDETLMAFADGELTPREQEAVERAMENDPALAERVAAFLDSRAKAQDALGPLLDEPVPEALTARIRALANEGGNVTAFPQKQISIRRPGPRWALPLAASIALIAGGLGGYFAGNTGQGQQSRFGVAEISQPAVTAALDTVAAGSETGLSVGERFRAIASYRDADGTFCREFEVDRSDGSTIVSIACRPETIWKLQFTVIARQSSTGYAPASSLETLDAYLSAVGAGAPMSAEEERAILQSLE
ncbi:anti-sigma factor [Hoeflea poritis]|uniref:Anti-sigma factor n=1 Tax=Hoeflea poritis TaxID=2993659 RepID=A0ABT4VHY2_9HYPH|nr:anti-sigma factor [Hoeflea poritis]MDA4844281.1 anti-sigma factor [Hoeflea poritis]